MTRTMVSKFQRGSGTYKCESCGRATRETGHGESDLRLCRKCYNGAGLENEHSDYGHGEYLEDCPTCRADA